MNEDVTKTEWDGRTPGCVAPAVLLDYHRKRLSQPEKKDVRRHLRRCPACKRDSRFVAIIIRDENRLIRGLEALLPARLETAGSTAAGARRKEAFRPAHSIVAAAAAAGIILAFLVFPPGRWTRPAVLEEPDSIANIKDSAGGTANAEPAFLPRLDRLFPQPRDIRERLIHSGILSGPDFDPPPEPVPAASRALASFEISQKRERDEEFFGWSLASRPETGSAYSVLSPR